MVYVLNLPASRNSSTSQRAHIEIEDKPIFSWLVELVT